MRESLIGHWWGCLVLEARAMVAMIKVRKRLIWSSWKFQSVDFLIYFVTSNSSPPASACIRGLRIGFGGGPGVLEPFGGSEGSRGSGRFRRVRRKVSDVRCLEFWR